MYHRDRYRFKDMVTWTLRESLLFIALATALVIVHKVFDQSWLALPWTPIAVLGTAVAFVVGFQNNAAYERLWEARKIWGGIINTSRTWGMHVQAMVGMNHARDLTDDPELKEHIRILTYRHIAWLTALRYAMRSPKPWEQFMSSSSNRKWSIHTYIPERRHSLEDALADYLDAEEMEYVLSKSNKQTALIYLQSRHLRRLKDRDLLWEFSFLELEKILQELLTLQGKSERIKNFPYPRHYATIGHHFVWLFIFLVPFGVVPQFSALAATQQVAHPQMAPWLDWASVPFCAMLCWVFHTMLRIGRAGENPFEGTANDVPISGISRDIETNLRQMLDEDPQTIPPAFPIECDVQM